MTVMWSSVQSSPRLVYPVTNRHHQNHASSSASSYAASWLLGRGESRRVVARQLNGIISRSYFTATWYCPWQTARPLPEVVGEG